MKTQHDRRYKKILDELKDARLKAGITQLEVAKHLGKHPPHIFKIEAGERRLDIIELTDLCQFYGISLTKLLKLAGL